MSNRLVHARGSVGRLSKDGLSGILPIRLASMNLSSNGQVIGAATKDLSVRWANLQSSWNDSKSREFEERFLFNLTSSAERAVPVFDQLQKLLAKVREDCE